MRPRNRAIALAALAGAAAIALPVLAQDSRPESLLPPGFGEPAPAPAAGAAPAAPTPAAPAAPAPVTALPAAEGQQIVTVAAPPPPSPDELAAAEEAKQADELPPQARRPIDRVGPLAVARGGFAPDAFGRADGRFLVGLMTRLDAPVASRWASMLLRRALLSPIPAPARVQPADWVAERAALLLRMGEADAARLLVQSVDGDRYTARLYAVALATAEATSDPVALCGIADRGAAANKAPEWQLARAICAGLSGDSATSGEILDKARADRTAGGIDLLLAEKLAAAGTNDRRAITISWRSVNKLTPWRFGMGNAAFVPLTPQLLEGGGPAMTAWAARTPAIPYSARIDPARTAAVLGVFSNSALVDLYSTLGDDADPTAEDNSVTGRLRLAYAAPEQSDRVAALRKIWADPPTAADRYANAILTARAAALIQPKDDFASDAGDLIAAMLSAGFDRRAAQWAPLLPSGSSGELGWSLLAVAAPRPVITIDAKRIAGMGQTRRAQLLVAGLAGLGRLPADALGELDGATAAGLGHQDAWTRAIDGAAARGQSGMVALLAAIGLQSPAWDGVPPAYLRHIVAALAATGHEAEARMIAAEAISRSA
ncbi:hypothetical protein [Sphingomonas quercus]|uniref:Antifreeze glycopeptide polyprotein n=1 Tax=Sphingomonas quercus TaxID=2842451 RepID=A0ABS6BDH9_9SPHN|nr:hypothetical protein [Sphingomonas quercus]MBU3076367.1 hypothetical protein [Sphingomonas quercus]